MVGGGGRQQTNPKLLFTVAHFWVSIHEPPTGEVLASVTVGFKGKCTPHPHATPKAGQGDLKCKIKTQNPKP